MDGAGASLISGFDDVWERFTTRWVLDGAELGPDPDLDPLPLTTIAWRIGHVGLLRDLYLRLRS